MNPTKQGLKLKKAREALRWFTTVLAHESNKTRIETACIAMAAA